MVRDLPDRALIATLTHGFPSARAGGIIAPIGNHSYRATGITAYLANGGALEHAPGRNERMVMWAAG
jgi:hypothetical protein